MQRLSNFDKIQDADLTRYKGLNILVFRSYVLSYTQNTNFSKWSSFLPTWYFEWHAL